MKVLELLESRRRQWHELEELCQRMQGHSQRTVEPELASRFSALYRAACADLALADAYQLPPDTTDYLHRLVGRAHNQLYRSRTFRFATWARQLLVDVPQRLFNDNCLRLAFCLFWGIFLLSMYLAYQSPTFAEQVLGREQIQAVEEMYSKDAEVGDFMVGFYIWHNGGIGLRCFAFGLLFGIGGIYETVFNAVVLGTIFGHMATVPERERFFHFVTAHGPFELTAVVLSAAAGMRLGFALVDTRGLRRVAALRQAAQEAVPTISAAVLMFIMAALLETFLSPSPAPYWIKAFVAVGSAALLTFYFVVLGYPRGE